MLRTEWSEQETVPLSDYDKARVDMLDHLIDRYFAADKNYFLLPISTIHWLRSQPEYIARYGHSEAGRHA